MRILLAVVPQCEVETHPLLALPALAGNLAFNGYRDVEQADFSVDIDEWFTSRACVEQMHARVAGRLAQLEACPSLCDDEAALYTRLKLADETYPLLLNSLDRARDLHFNVPRLFFVQDELGWATNVLLQAYRLVGAAHHPSVIEPGSFETPYSVHSSHEILAASKDPSLNPYIEAFRQRVLPSIEPNAYDLIGLSVMFFDQLIPAFTLARLIGGHSPRTHVALGGGAVSMLFTGREQINPALFEHVDSIVVQEGEQPLLELVRALDGKGDLEAVSNRIYLGSQGQVVQSELSRVKLSELPPPIYGRDLRPEPHYPVPWKLPISVSRGCYFQDCAFCNCYKSLFDGYDSIRATTAVDRIEALVAAYGVHHYIMVDDIVGPGFLRRFAEELLRRGLSITWENNTRFEKNFDRELCALLYRAGCRYMKFGFESGCQRVLDFMEKGTLLSTIEGVLDACQRADIRVHTYVIFGIPTETYEENQETIDFLKQNWERIDSFNIAFFQLQDHSPMMADPARFQISNIRPPAGQDLPLEYEFDAPGPARDEFKQFTRKKSGELQRWFYGDRGFRPSAVPTLPRRDPVLTGSLVPSYCPWLRHTLFHRDVATPDPLGGGGENRPVLFDALSHQVRHINHVGALVLDLCDGTKTLDDIVGWVAKDYGVSPDSIREDIHDFYEELLAFGHQFEGPYTQEQQGGARILDVQILGG